MSWFVDTDGEVKRVTDEMRSDPFRDTFTEYDNRADAEEVAEIGDWAAGHRRSQRKLKMTDVEYGRHAHYHPGLSDGDYAKYAREVKGE